MIGGWIEEFDTDLTVVMGERRLPTRSDYFAELQTSKLEHAENLSSAADVAGITDTARFGGFGETFPMRGGLHRHLRHMVRLLPREYEGHVSHQGGA